jgi:hypothetical protein
MKTSSSRVGIWIAIAALLVNMPRFVILFLDVDGIDIGLDAEGVLLGLSGIATGLVLSGGGAYIAHTIAQPGERNWIATLALLLCWVALLVFSVVLLAPSLVMAVRNYEMATVLDTNEKQWWWSTVAIIAVEVLAAGAMVAHAVSGAPVQEKSTQPGAWSKIFDAASNAAVAKLNRVAQDPPQPIMQLVTTTPAQQPPPLDASPPPQPAQLKPASGIAQRHETLLRLLSNIELPEDINKAELGRELGVSRTQIGKDIDAMIKAGHLSVNGTVKVHVGGAQ